jgi:hypothetical protein
MLTSSWFLSLGIQSMEMRKKAPNKQYDYFMVVERRVREEICGLAEGCPQ